MDAMAQLPLPAGLGAGTFPAKLWSLVNDPCVRSLRWDSEARGLLVDRSLFERELLRPGGAQGPAPNAFRATQFRSFVRQLYRYGFCKGFHGEQLLPPRWEGPRSRMQELYGKQPPPLDRELLWMQPCSFQQLHREQQPPASNPPAAAGTSAPHAPAGSAGCAASTASSSAQNAPAQEESPALDLGLEIEKMIREIRNSLPVKAPSAQGNIIVGPESPGEEPMNRAAAEETSSGTESCGNSSPEPEEPACTMLRNQTLHGVVQRLLEEEGKRNKCKTTASVSTQTVVEETGTASMQTVTEEKGTKNKATVSASTQTITEEKGTKTKATVSVSTQAVTEEKETKGAISISTQTVTEAEQPKPVAVAPVQKKKSKSKSVRIMTDEDVAGPSHSAEETEPEIIARSLSLGELRDLRREFTRQTNESILTWLLRIWDAAANDTILDGSEARQLGSLSRDVVIDQGIGRTQQTLSLWRRLLTSVRDRYLCKEDLQVHQGKWSTMEQGIRCLRELAVLEIIFSEDERFPKSPDDVQCTSQMWLRFARLGPEMYSRYLATLQWREGEDKVGVLVNKLRIYEDTVTAPFRTHVSSVETRLAEQVRSLIEEGHQKLKKELKEEIYHISPEPTRVSAIRSRYPPARERGYTPRGNLWSFLREHGEDMRNWDGKPTSSLAARVRELKRETPTTKSSSRANTAPVSKAQNSRQYKKNDMTDPLEGTSGTYLQEESNVYHDQE
ncbi:hypothetical protein DUI87_28637 [Hirundo rustica rustica]|uniref:HSF-type DNA-binding domain-containing protein n=1 Tax=Hirundo rustica rustica TaxID=333673 RepID=A0A3M0J1S0_HIRRU|nr:hypothetical protein DUI87_28637 [Hirundo rustica rustica]